METNTRLVNDCEKCQAFDEETKRLVRSFLSTEECSLISFLLASSVQNSMGMMRRPGTKMTDKLLYQRNKDFAATLLAKFLLSFNEPEKVLVENQIQKKFGLALNISHERCPHQEASA